MAIGKQRYSTLYFITDGGSTGITSRRYMLLVNNLWPTRELVELQVPKFFCKAIGLVQKLQFRDFGDFV